MEEFFFNRFYQDPDWYIEETFCMDPFFVDPDISKARTLDTSFYTDPFHFERAKELIFLPSWQYVTNRSEIGARCNPLTLLPRYLDEPLVITSNDRNQLRCLSNVCTHRGNILVNEPCNTSTIRCRYHGRLFRMDGQFVSMPEFKEVEDFPSAADDLPSFPLQEFGDMLFCSLGQRPFAEYFQEMMDRIAFLPIHEFKYRPELSQSFDVNAHWALYCENYLEGFHIPFVHAGLNSVIDYGSYTTELFRYSNVQVGIAKEGEPVFELPENSVDYGRKIAAYYFFVFPNMMFNFYPWGLSLNIVEPVSISTTRVRFLTYTWKPELYNTGAGSGLNQVELEDEEVVESVQKGIRSRFYKHGRYSVTRETGIHQFHRLIAGALT